MRMMNSRSRVQANTQEVASFEGLLLHRPQTCSSKRLVPSASCHYCCAHFWLLSP
jgi:hypothetical protein